MFDFNTNSTTFCRQNQLRKKPKVELDSFEASARKKKFFECDPMITIRRPKPNFLSVSSFNYFRVVEQSLSQISLFLLLQLNKVKKLILKIVNFFLKIFCITPILINTYYLSLILNY
ncbi:hypothetical protein BpHYR1_025009 [Brachionus plicatilis]|uniref:Uncharacterized protein n=1 Tax=Brachionus plicatilis TaxID=10195 RepID=A0A3M7RYZ8_BRAPC|nr:hypothetical protein BpHYR1_025009 [Brachionus plicatilis]